MASDCVTLFNGYLCLVQPSVVKCNLDSRMLQIIVFFLNSKINMHLLHLLLEDYLQMLFPEQFSILDQCNWIKIFLFIHSFILVKLDCIVFPTSNYYGSYPSQS